MIFARNLVIAVALAVLFSGQSAWAADDLQRVLHELDVAAANFHSTSADFEFDSNVTDPIPDKDVQKGTVYYERKGTGFQMAAHIQEVNGKPVPKIYTMVGGSFQLYEPMIDQLITSQKVSQYASYLELGFGASGKDLAEKWNIKYLGPETIDKVKTEKLELVAKDPAVLKYFSKVTVWLDTSRAVSLKQYFDEGPGASRECFYYNIKVNQPIAPDVFKIKTDSKTQFVRQ
ncbi:MAG: outer membrane lipoprotein-sorting protein [Terracidiphilus sp.]